MTRTIHNLIILDKSGSMTAIRRQAVAGVAETLSTIRAIQDKDPETLQLVSLVAFCSCDTTYLLNSVRADMLPEFDPSSYQPCCGTPLYDTIGRSCTRMAKQMGNDPNSIGSVTIITDGYENSSREWTGAAVKSLIEQYKAQGWLFAYIGADHDVEAVASSLSIDNSLAFDKSPEGTLTMFEQERKARMRWSDKIKGCRMPLRNMDQSADYFEK